MKPRIFVSAVSRELKTARQLVANTLLALGYEPVWQDIFETSSEDIRPMLRRQINSCSAVIQIVGDAYGAEPPSEDEEFGRVSYTQFEAKYAESIGKKVYYLIAQRDMPRDELADEIDGHASETLESKSDAAERTQLQNSYLEQIQSKEHIFYAVESHSEAELSVRRLKQELDRLRRGFRRWMIGVSTALVLIAVVLGVVYIQQNAERTRQEQERIAQQEERKKQQLEREAAQAARQRAVKEQEVLKGVAERFLNQVLLDKELSAEQARQQAISELPAIVNLSLDEIQVIIDRKIPLLENEKPATPLEKARLALAQGNYDAVFSEADREKEKDRELAILEGTAALARFRENPNPKWNQRALNAFEKALANSEANSAEWADAAVAEANVLADLAMYPKAEMLLNQAVNIRKRIFGGDSTEIAAVLNNIALLFMATNRLGEAEPLMRRALEIDEKLFGANHPSVGTSLSNLALLLKATNRLNEAEQLMRRALAINENRHGANHTKVAAVLNNLAAILKATNRLTEAEPLMRRALAIDEKLYGSEHPKVATESNNLALLLQETGHLNEAERLLRRALLTFERSVGANHPDNVAGLRNLAQLLKETDRLREAESLARRALAISEKKHEANHHDIAKSLNLLAELLQETNRLREAERLIQRALVIDENAFGTDHPNVSIRLNSLANLLHNSNRVSEAIPLMCRALAINEKTYGVSHPQVAINLNNLAQLLRSVGRRSLAESLLRRALVINEKCYGSDSTHSAVQLNNLALLLKATNRPTEAEPLMRRALAIDENRYGAKHSRVAVVLNNLAVLLKATNRLNEAELLMRRALAIDEELYGSKHPKVAKAINDLAQLLILADRPAEAEPLMRRVLAIDEELYGSKHPKVAKDIYNLAQLFLITKRLAEAEPLMRSVVEHNENLYGGSHPNVAESLSLLALLLRATNRLAKAEPLMRRALEIYASDLGVKHPETLFAKRAYQRVLDGLNLGSEESRHRVRKAMKTKKSFQPILPTVEQLLGPAEPIASVLTALDRQYREQNKPAIYFLPLDEPIAEHIESLLKPTPNQLITSGVGAYRNGRHEEAVALYDQALRILGEDPEQAAGAAFQTRMNRAAAMRELGEPETARDDLIELMDEMESSPDSSPLLKGRSAYHLAYCHWRLGDNESAENVIKRSIAEHGDDKSSAALKKQSEELLSEIREGKQPPKLPEMKPELALQRAKSRLSAMSKLAELSDSEPAAPLIDEILGPAKPVEDVFKKLDQQYREQGKPDIWFLPITEPISPHLDELLGKVESGK